MRALSKEETQAVFKKLVQFLGKNAELLLELTPPHVFRLNQARVFIMSETLVKACSSIPKKQLIAAGVCIGKFTKSKRFHLQISALEYLAQFCTNKVWLKASAEGSFLYGNHILKRHVAKMTENIPAKAGVVICSPTDTPLGFGVLNFSTLDLRARDTETIAVFNQSDLGLYLRKEREMFGGGVQAEEHE
eukprot:Protomagalhaensia_wolfi_Nauph_80__1775@NODE_2104_length_1212_cov_29_504689_g1645_i0_p1_GENE_NODE_2104_length_1212_cov_29_504689_g1645_i0NODE_2104_length_1212_cov_29_504689_g1645_i0_p1_ORF_typecomplete_len190_score35_28UPF0113/PF03657_13/5_5e30UPF0113_N/PF17833_1/1_4e25UPF0113_N/PF17833_1/1_2e04PUA/PF01472_20/2_4e03PUA/PF01472_20/0_0067_NODE_2104_length_1212_cov_29_504689_g1645_i029598